MPLSMPRQAFEMSKSVAMGEIFRRSWTTEAVAGSRKSRETEQLRMHSISWPRIPAWSSALRPAMRSEEHTSELQSRLHLVCRLLLEKKKKEKNITNTPLHEYTDTQN